MKLSEIAALQTSADDPSDITTFNEEVTRRTTELRALRSRAGHAVVDVDVRVVNAQTQQCVRVER